MIEERKPPESCMECPKYIYKGEDEQYCQAAHMRDFVLKRWQKKPKWCPIERRFRADAKSKIQSYRSEKDLSAQ